MRRMPWLVIVSGLAAWACQGVEARSPDSADLTPEWKALGAPRAQAAGRMPALVGRRGSPTAVWGNVAGWNEPGLRPSNRSTAIAVSPDGRQVAVAWLHNADPEGPPLGEPTAYASVGRVGGSFATATAIGARPFAYLPGALDRVKKYNTAHNAPVLLPVPGGFLALTMPMNANGYAEMRPPTGYAYAQAAWAGGRWAPPTLVPLADTRAGSSLSEVSGARAPDGTLHLFGQGHLGRFQGAFAHQRRRAGHTAWESVTLAEAYRPRGMNYFAEGAGAVTPQGVLHVAFAWNRQGATPMFGLYHLMSRDGGKRWCDAAGRPVAVPLRAGVNDAPAAVVRASLSDRAYAGAAPGVHGLSLAVAPDGRPVIVRLHQLPHDADRVQARVHLFDGRRWTSIAVGRPAFWNQGGTAVAVNARTGRVNVLLLDPGGRDRPAQVTRYDAPLTSLRQGRAAWRSAVVGEAPNATHYGSSLAAAVAPNRAFVFVFEPSYRNPGRVSPVMGQAPMR
ncbi:MAG: hypothetical protein ACK46X_17655 [Candidatus Sericytochromatia bacterium]